MYNNESFLVYDSGASVVDYLYFKFIYTRGKCRYYIMIVYSFYFGEISESLTLKYKTITHCHVHGRSHFNVFMIFSTHA